MTAHLTTAEARALGIINTPKTRRTTRQTVPARQCSPTRCHTCQYVAARQCDEDRHFDTHPDHRRWDVIQETAP